MSTCSSFAKQPRRARARAAAVSSGVGLSADGRAANPFESVLRGISADVPGLHLVPQVTIGSGAILGTPDLVDVDLGIVVEAESWSYHGGRAAFDRDVRRYTAMARAGWLVMHFLWNDVIHHPDEVRATSTDAVRVANRSA